MLIPRTNVKNLMLRDFIVKAVEEEKFYIYPVETIDQGMEILEGELKEDGTYPEGTINHAVDRRLSEFADCWKGFRGGEAEQLKNENDG